MQKTKKAFSMIVTLLVIIVFSFFVILGLKMSALQLQTMASWRDTINGLRVLDNLEPLVTQLIRKEEQCIDNFSITYDNYEIHNSITYFPACTEEDLNTSASRYIKLDIRLVDTKNDTAFTRTFSRVVW